MRIRLRIRYGNAVAAAAIAAVVGDVANVVATVQIVVVARRAN